jgi:predicted transcriptional regulator
MSNEAEDPAAKLSRCVTEIVAAYVTKNHVPRDGLPALIATVHASLAGLANGQANAEAEDEVKASPAQIRRSVTPDALISFLDGKPYSTLRRHLGAHGMDPDSYRARYGLPRDYPMVAASFSAKRAAVARKSGLGKKRGRLVKGEA